MQNKYKFIWMKSGSFLFKEQQIKVGTYQKYQINTQKEQNGEQRSYKERLKSRTAWKKYIYSKLGKI